MAPPSAPMPVSVIDLGDCRSGGRGLELWRHVHNVLSAVPKILQKVHIAAQRRASMLAALPPSKGEDFLHFASLIAANTSRICLLKAFTFLSQGSSASTTMTSPCASFPKIIHLLCCHGYGAHCTHESARAVISAESSF